MVVRLGEKDYREHIKIFINIFFSYLYSRFVRRITRILLFNLKELLLFFLLFF